MERTNVQLDPAEVDLDAPRKSDILKQLSRGPPRNGGLTKLNTLEDWAEFSNQRNFESIRKYLLETNPTSIQDFPKPEARKHFLEGIFRPRFNRNSKQSRKELQTQSPDEEQTLPVLNQRTSKGRRYGQIVTSQVYDAYKNASTYKVNLSRGASDALASEEERKLSFAKDDLKAPSGYMSLPMRKKGLKDIVHPAHRLSAHQAQGQQSSTQDLSAYQIIALQEPTAHDLANNLRTGTSEEEPTPGKTISDTSKPMIDAPLRPLHHTNESFFGLSKEHSHLLLRDDRKVDTPSALRTLVSKADSQPNIRDFAPNGPATVQRSRAVRLRSRSPVKRSGKQKSTTISASDFPIFPTYNGRVTSSEASSPQTRKPISIYTTTLSQGPSSTSVPTSPKPNKVFQSSSILDSPPKNSSMISAESNQEDVYSDTSSVIVSDAQSAILIRSRGATNKHTCTPPQPGPAPTRALPSLPEGQAPLTPQRHSESSQPSPERLAPINVPPKSPARYRYTPMNVNVSPRKTEESPPKDVILEAEAMGSPAAVASVDPVKQGSQGQTYEKAEPLPKSMSMGNMEIRHQRRVDNIKVMKARDMARMKNQKATGEESGPDTIAGANMKKLNTKEYREVRHEGVELLPSPTDLDDSTSTPSSLSTDCDDSQLNRLSAETTLLHRDSSIIPRPQSQDLSPIIVIAEQEPNFLAVPIQRAHSHKENSATEYQRHPLSFKSTNSFQPFPFPPISRPLAPSLHITSNNEVDTGSGIRIRPSSAHSMPQPSTTTTGTNPIRARAPPPFSPSLLRAQSLSKRSPQSQRSSGMYNIDADADTDTNAPLNFSDLEARMEALESKYLRLEKAFLASEEGRRGSGLSGEASLSGLGLGLSTGEEKRASAATGAGKLYAGLESLLAVHAGDFGAPDAGVP